MKKFKLIFSFIVFFCMTSVISAQVNVQGSLSFSTTWTKALSPYNVVGDVQVPTGVTLTIEPGVEVRYTGDYELLVKGKLLANGTSADSIVFRSDVSGTKKGKRFLNFEGTNLATHQVSYVKMVDGNMGIQVGNESESAQGDKNTGKLVVNHINIKNTDILTKGYSTGAQLSINYGTIETSVVRGSYPLSEKILLKGLSIKNSILSSDSYNVGLALDSCNVQGGKITVGCCGANVDINRSELQRTSIVEGGGSPVTGPFKINSTKMLNCSFNLPYATVEIKNSIINTGSGKLMTFGNGLVDGTTITGNGTGNGLTITGYNGYNIGGTISVTNSTITNFNKGIQITGANTVTIQHNNILANKAFNVENTSTTPITATYNWWGAIDEIKIGELLWDKSDDINKGEISHTNSLTSPYISAPVILPLNVTKQLSVNTVIVKWKANNETDISGYKIYYGSTDGIHFSHVINAGKVSADTLASVSFNDSIAVTAYDINADGLNDQIEGHESWYSRAGLPKAQISLSSTSIIMGAVQLNSTVSKKLLIANNGTSDLIISNIVFSNNMFAVNKTSFTVKPDSTCELQVLFTPTSLGQKSGTITIYHNSKDISTVLNVSGMGVANTGTSVCGIISQNTTWQKINSPYYVSCDVQVPSGITLTIEPGVEVRYTGDYELLIKGQLIANGTSADSIVFRSDVSGTKKGKRFLNFEGTNLATHQVSYVKMVDGNMGIQVGNESESAQGDKNTGKLVVNHINIKNTDILTKGYSTGAQLSINYGTIETSVVRGSYPLSEKILLKGLSIKNSILSSDSYNMGLTLDSCNVHGGQITVGCCGANIEINRSELQGLNIVEGGGSPVTGPFKINSTKMLNCSFNLPYATVEIKNSIINTGSGKLMTFGNGLVDGTTITGNGTGNGLTITGYNGYNIGGTISVTNSTITNFNKGIQITGANTVTIQHNNILANKAFNVENTSTTPITATYNWWGAIDEIKIGELLWDKSDDINKGEISHTNSLTSPYISAPVILPLSVTKQLSGNTVIVKWKANNETDISGYKIYYGSTDGIHFSHVINAGNVSADTLANISFNDSIAVTAYDINADGLNDQIEGHESWYSRAGIPSAVISVSSTNMNMGLLQLNHTTSKKILITNKGGSDLVISNIAISSSCFTVNKTNFTVKPDSVSELKIYFKPTSLGQVSGTMTLYNNSIEKTSVIGLSGIGVTDAGTGVSGIISQDTIWRKTNSPYYILSDVQVPAGVTLTIEPGVEVRYTGDYELLIKGQLIANGTPADTIVFRSDVSGTKKGKRFLNFEGTNLAIHQVSYVKMLDGNMGIQVGNESESAQGDKNTGKLVVNHINIKNTDILTKGYSTGAQLSINYGTIETSVVRGSYPLSEKILLKGLSIKNSILSSDSYNVGLALDSCNVQGGQITVGCCGANVDINRSELQGTSIVEGGGSPVTGPFKINSTKMLNCSFNLPYATVEIKNSIINSGSGKFMTFGNGLVDGTAITGNGTGNGLTITGYSGYNIGGTISVTNSTITNFDKGIQITGANTVTIQHNNILANKTFNIENTSTTPINATYNWWGTNDIAILNAKVFDKLDDINKGEVLYSPLLMSENGESNYVPVVTNFITPLLGEVPLEVTFKSSATDTDGSIKSYKWDFNGDNVYDFTSVLNGDTTVTYTKGGNFVTESNVSDNKNLSNRLFYKIAVIDFNSKSENLGDSTVIVNWGWGKYHTVVVDASAFSFLSEGDVINIYDNAGNTSSNCSNSNEYGKVLVSSLTYSTKNDSVYVFNCQSSVNMCTYNSTMKPGYIIGHQMFFEVQSTSSSFGINPTIIKSGSINFTDSAFTLISKFELGSVKSLVESQKKVAILKSANVKSTTFNVYRNNVIFKQGVSDLYILDRNLNANTEYCYDIYLIKNGTQVLSKSTCVKAKINNSVKTVTNILSDIYPNPVRESLTITTKESLSGALVTIYDIFGKELLNKEINNSKTIINVDKLKSGIYFLRLTNDEKIQVRKFIKE